MYLLSLIILAHTNYHIDKNKYIGTFKGYHIANSTKIQWWLKIPNNVNWRTSKFHDSLYFDNIIMVQLKCRCFVYVKILQAMSGFGRTNPYTHSLLDAWRSQCTGCFRPNPLSGCESIWSPCIDLSLFSFLSPNNCEMGSMIDIPYEEERSVCTKY